MSGFLIGPCGVANAAAGGGAFTPTSQQSTDFLARAVSAGVTLTTARKTLYDAMITGIVTDLGGSTASSTWPLLDALYILAAPDTTTANLNLCSSSYGLTQTGTVTLAADVGYTGDGSTGFLSTGFNPATATTPNYIQNSATVATYIQTNRTTGAVTTAIGAGDGGSDFTFISPLRSGSLFSFEVNGGGFPTLSNASAQGAWVVSRSSSTVTTVYENAATPLGTAGDTSSAPFNAAFYICALNNNGTAAQFSNDQISAAFIGGALTSTQAFAINARINTFMAGLPTPVNLF